MSEHSTLDKFSDEERERLLRELADEENDPQYKPTVGFPFESLCKLSREICLKVSKDDACKRVACLEKYLTCKSKLPLTPGEKKCLDNGKPCLGIPGLDCKRKLICIAAVQICLGVAHLVPSLPVS